MASVAYHSGPYERPAKPPKDPNKPKKKKSSFDVFRVEQMQEFKRLNPDTKVDLGVFMTNLSQTWNTLSEERKRPYVLESEKDALRFEEEMASYVPAPEYLQPRRGKKRKRVKEPGEPKRAMTAFMFFSNMTRTSVVAEHPDLKIGPIAKILGERWNNMTDAEKAPYAKMTEDDKVRYNTQMEEFRRLKQANANGMGV